VVLIVIGATMLWFSLRLELGTPSSPGAGFMPFGSLMLLLIVSILGLIFIPKDGGDKAWAGPNWKRVFYALAPLFVYALILTKVGYIVSTFILMVFLFSMSGERKWITNIIVSIICVFTTYIIFNKWLDCQLPIGWFGF
jgi:putative tricarboxylic transport membrane protein